MKREALVHLTKRVYRQIYTYRHTHTHTHMRMGFRPLVNLSAPMGGANINSIFSTTARSFVNPFLNQSSSYPIDNNHSQQQQQQHKDDNNEDDDPDLKVELENKQLWDAFHAHGTEMVTVSNVVFFSFI